MSATNGFNDQVEASKWLEKCIINEKFGFSKGAGAVRLLCKRNELKESFPKSMGVLKYLDRRSKIDRIGHEVAIPVCTEVCATNFSSGGNLSIHHNAGLYSGKVFLHLNLMPVYYDYPVGHPNFLLRRVISDENSKKALVGEIDVICLNINTGGLVLVDLKTKVTENKTGESCKESFYKAKHVRQLTIYGMMLTVMAKRKRMAMPKIDYLLIIGTDTLTKRAASYKFEFHPRSALAECKEFYSLYEELVQSIR